MKITIEGSKLYDRELELDAYSLSVKERRRIKELTGLAGVAVMEALLIEDPDIYFGLAVVALERAGVAVDVPMLEETEGLRFTLDFSTENGRVEGEGPKDRPPNGGESATSESEKSGSSGGNSPPDGETTAPGSVEPIGGLG